VKVTGITAGIITGKAIGSSAGAVFPIIFHENENGNGVRLDILTFCCWKSNKMRMGASRCKALAPRQIRTK